MARANNRVFKIVLLAIGLALLGFHLKMGPLFYFSPEFTARVTDEETGEPIEGAAVLAAWWMDGGVLHPASKLLHVEEALTNEDGRFTIDGWWPRLRPPFYRFEAPGPALVLFKRGYEAQRISYQSSKRSWRLGTFWAGKTVSLEREPTNSDAFDSCDWANFYLESVQHHAGTRCCPLFTEALQRGCARGSSKD